jgi:hypothetical protein
MKMGELELQRLIGEILSIARSVEEGDIIEQTALYKDACAALDRARTGCRRRREKQSLSAA